MSTEYEEEIERWKVLYEEQAIREQELTKNVDNKYQVTAWVSNCMSASSQKYTSICKGFGVWCDDISMLADIMKKHATCVVWWLWGFWATPNFGPHLYNMHQLIYACTPL